MRRTSRLFGLALLGPIAVMSGSMPGDAIAAGVPFDCSILPGNQIGSVLLTNSMNVDASCIVTCKFSTTKYDNNPQITCAKPVPAGKQVEMCEVGSGGDKMVKSVDGNAQCRKLR